VRSKSDDYTCRTARKRLVDGGSNPPSSTTIQKTNHSRLVFFCPYPPVPARVQASLRRTPLSRTPGSGSFSVLRTRPFSVSAKDDSAPKPAMMRASILQPSQAARTTAPAYVRRSPSQAEVHLLMAAQVWFLTRGSGRNCCALQLAGKRDRTE